MIVVPAMFEKNRLSSHHIIGIKERRAVKKLKAIKKLFLARLYKALMKLNLLSRFRPMENPLIPSCRLETLLNDYFHPVFL